MSDENNENSDLQETQESLQSMNINSEITDNSLDSEANKKTDKQKGSLSCVVYKCLIVYGVFQWIFC